MADMRSPRVKGVVDKKNNPVLELKLSRKPLASTWMLIFDKTVIRLIKGVRVDFQKSPDIVIGCFWAYKNI